MGKQTVVKWRCTVYRETNVWWHKLHSYGRPGGWNIFVLYVFVRVQKGWVCFYWRLFVMTDRAREPHFSK